jgi:hypothetical protein
MRNDPFDPKNLELPPELGAEVGKKPLGAAAAKPRRPRQQAERYIQLTAVGARGFVIAGAPAALVWFEILYRVWKTKKMTVGLPNGTLTEMGVPRWAKYRALRRLEQAGWIKVERRDRKTIRVTLLTAGCLWQG